MMVEVATTDSFANARALPPIAALPESDFTAKMLLENLPAGQDIFYRVRFRDLAHIDIQGEPVVGRFRTAPADRRDVSFVWGGDVAGQGWGINPDDGGMFTFATMRKHRPCCTPATPSMPTGRSGAKWRFPTARSGRM
jgi:alkaline phosphatase D